MKTFEVLVTGLRTVLVEAEDADEAAEIASEECTSLEWDIQDWVVERELRTPDEIASARRHGSVLLRNW